jgi:hypothetical protein
MVGTVAVRRREEKGGVVPAHSAQFEQPAWRQPRSHNWKRRLVDAVKIGGKPGEHEVK